MNSPIRKLDLALTMTISTGLKETAKARKVQEKVASKVQAKQRESTDLRPVEFQLHFKEVSQSPHQDSTYALVTTYRVARMLLQEGRARRGSMCAVSVNQRTTLSKPARTRANDRMR
jgi:hypothetical protein